MVMSSICVEIGYKMVMTAQQVSANREMFQKHQSSQVICFLLYEFSHEAKNNL